MSNKPEKVTLSGRPPENPDDGGAPAPIDPKTGMHKDYWVLSEAERSKGFVRPVRRSYRHVGIAGSKHPLRDLTAEEAEDFSSFGYVKYEAYPESERPVVGRYWTQKELDRLGVCNTTTTMSQPLAETYARDPGFYGSTFCCACGKHIRVEEFVWDGTNERVGS